MLNIESSNFKGLGFRIGKDGPKIYEKTINKLALHTSTQFKNGTEGQSAKFIHCGYVIVRCRSEESSEGSRGL